jgi:holliday junction DNA helicase RuvA
LIARIRGELIVRELDRVEVMTTGGVAYEIFVPTTVYERLPRLGEEITLRVYHLVREDAVQLFGFLEDSERKVFARLLGATGVGPRLALALLSAMRADQLVRVIRERDVTTLTGVSGVGRKTAERIALELSGKLDDVAVTPGPAVRGPGAEEALRALTALGVAPPEADRAVRAVIQEEGAALPVQELIRRALARLR